MATEEFGAVTFGKGGKVIPLSEDNATYEFPDEVEAKQEAEVKAKAVPEVDIEIVDDTPDEDKGREPMDVAPEDVDDDELGEYDKKVQKRLKKFSKGYHDERVLKKKLLGCVKKQFAQPNIWQMKIASYNLSCTMVAKFLSSKVNLEQKLNLVWLKKPTKKPMTQVILMLWLKHS